MKSHLARRSAALVCALAFALSLAIPQTTVRAQQRVDDSMMKGLKWRSIGPYRGGRSAAVAGVTSQPQVFYFGATGGSVWKTTDGGINWENVSDNYFKTAS